MKNSRGYEWKPNDSGEWTLTVSKNIRFEVYVHSMGYDTELFLDNSECPDCNVGMNAASCRTAKKRAERLWEEFMR